MFSIHASAKNAEVPKVLTQVLNDSTIQKYLSKYGNLDSSGIAVFENHGNYYIYNDSIKDKHSALSQAYIGVIKTIKISPKRAKVRIYVINNHFTIKAKLSRDNNCQPWLVNSRLVSNLSQIRNNQKRFFHYSKS